LSAKLSDVFGVNAVVFFVRSYEPNEQPLLFVVYLSHKSVGIALDIKDNPAVLQDAGVYIGLFYIRGRSPG